MSAASMPERLTLPPSLEKQMLGFRRRLWTIKMAEAMAAAVFGVVAAFLLVFLLDRIADTPAVIRGTLLIAAAFVMAGVPLALHTWIWRHRRLEQLARLLSRKMPQVGDQLLGIIELVRNENEQARSRALCEAAVRQVAEDAQHRDLNHAAPASRHRLWIALALSSLLVAATLWGLYPEAAANAWARFLAPWRPIERFTFAALQPLPDRLIVPHGEPSSFHVALQTTTRWRPAQAEARLPRHEPIVAACRGDQYEIQLPSLLEPTRLALRVGDARHTLVVEPVMRPELTAIAADVRLPSYLERAKPLRKDVRGGTITLVKGSRVAFTATASRQLDGAAIDRQAVQPRGAEIVSSAIPVEDERPIEFEWRDIYGLSGKEPFRLSVQSREDEPPSVLCEELPRQRVVLDSEQLAFNVRAQDDFGVKRVGLEWRTAPGFAASEVTRGERILAAGGPEQERLEIRGTFSATSLGITPQPIQLRIFAEDYYPGRERVYSSPYLFFVLDPEQHAIWLTEQLSKWHRQSLEVRDRELQLYETNKQLRAMSADELNRPDTRRKIEQQAAAEQANGRRLATLTAAGDQLLAQAARNPEFGVGYLEKWAEMLQILKDISAHRMPSVADLLHDAARSPRVASAPPSESGPQAGAVRTSTPGHASPSEADGPKKPPIPSIVDIESSQQPRDPTSNDSNSESKSSQPGLGLPQTLLAGSGKGSASCPAGQKVEEAVVKQEDLLAEFDKIADELNRVLGNLEGTTLVKRLKAASRLQYRVAGTLSDRVDATFGVSSFRLKDDEAKLLQDLAQKEWDSSHDVSVIMDDMQAYFERRRFVRFKNVLDEMKKTDVVGALRQLGDELRNESGLSIAQCEFWSDTLDRWAEDLVEATSGGT